MPEVVTCPRGHRWELSPHTKAATSAALVCPICSAATQELPCRRRPPRSPLPRISPVVQLVGWTVLDGQVTVPHPPGPAALEDADGDTIVNAKLGVRVGFGSGCEIYAGYGQALTGDTWYDNIVRLELRLFF